MTQVVWGQAPWLPSFLVSALQVVPKNLVWDQAVIRETDSPPRYPLRGAKSHIATHGISSNKSKGEIGNPSPLHPFTMPCKKRHSQPSLQTFKPP